MSRHATPDVVVRYVPMLGNWHVCHARSYQNAVRSPVNGKPTRADAVRLAEENGFSVVHHEHDQLQQSTWPGGTA